MDIDDFVAEMIEMASSLMVEAERVNQSESGGGLEYIDVEYGEEEQLSLFIKEDVKGYKCCSMLGVSVRNVETIGRGKYQEQ